MAKEIVGSKIKFNASRIFKGNPVIGKLVDEDDEWITVKLDHPIEGMCNYWDTGEEKQFRRSLINNLEIID